MSMKIEHAIHDTEVMKEYLEYRDEPRSWGLGVLIDIAHKYQKIEEIVERFKDQYDHTTSMDLMMEIKEVVEDGSSRV